MKPVHSEDAAGSEAMYPRGFFRREDESEDALFYSAPRLVVHIDDAAIGAVGEYLGQWLPEGAVILDLMSSWRSHLPPGFHKIKLVGIGLNAAEMADNHDLDEWAVRDLNRTPELPFPDDHFDTVIVTVSVQYLTRPIEVFREVNRTLKAGASFHVVYSNRMFPTKATYGWKVLDHQGRARLVSSYFSNSGGWETPQVEDISPQRPYYTDPVTVVRGRKL